MTDPAPWTIQRLLAWTKDHFAQWGSDSPRLDAEILLAEALECSRIELYTRFNEIPQEPALGRYRDWVKRRAAGEPVAYLVGHREFYSLRFDVTPDVLIPRPETEHLVVAAIEAAQNLAQPVRVADVGTGSGCIAITLCCQLPECHVTAVDCSNAALAVARRNAERHGVTDRIEFLESNLLEAVTDPPFDLVVSNPPYIGRREWDDVPPEVRDQEPEQALFAGEDGTEVIARLVSTAPAHLVPGGWLLYETSPIIMDRCLELTRATGQFDSIESIRDYAGHPRVVVARTRA